jgi:dihydrofolate reductase
MITTSVFVGTSVDGFIARRGGAVDFLGSADAIDSDMGFADFMATVDVMVMGRNTYDTVIDIIDDPDGPDWPYGEMKVFVLTHRPVDVRPELASVVETAALAPEPLLRELESRGYERVYVDGGQTVQSFLRDDLIDEIIITDVPVLIGGGIPLFGDLDADIRLGHVDSVVFENGCVQTRYRVLR